MAGSDQSPLGSPMALRENEADLQWLCAGGRRKTDTNAVPWEQGAEQFWAKEGIRSSRSDASAALDVGHTINEKEGKADESNGRM